jgi:mycobactin salicyl-AMP ligase
VPPGICSPTRRSGGRAAVPDPDKDLSEKICAAVVFSKSLVTLSESKAYLDERGVAGHARPDVLVPMWRCPQRRWQGRNKAIVKQLNPDD